MDKIDKFQLSQIELRQIAQGFCQQIAFGKQGQTSCFKMLPSYLPRAQGDERGCYIALDFGGTNVRALLIELLGDGAIECLQIATRKIPLALMSAQANAEQLFNFVASVVAEVALDKEAYPLAHTFSFPVRQTDVNCGLLVEWAKEFATVGVVGEDVNALLQRALSELGMGHIRPMVLINDTVATLLAASYTDRHTVIGSICGTGHNTAFYDAQSRMVINLESGNFDILPTNEYDCKLDASSNNPGKQRLEKMTAGRYLGELFRLASIRADFSTPFSLDTELLAEIISGRDSRFDDAERELAKAIVERAAAMIGASYAGIIMYLNMDDNEQVSIAVDGSLYEKMPLYAQGIHKTLDSLCGDRAKHTRVFAESRGSSVGAAVAAALVDK